MITCPDYIANKISIDLKRMQRFYGKPSDKMIDDYEKESAFLLKEGYIDSIGYGFKTKDGEWRVAIKYEIRGGVLIADDDPAG